TLAPPGGGDISLGSRDLKMMDGMRPSIWAGVVPTIRAHPLIGMGYGARVSETTDPRAFTPPDKLKTLTGPVEPHRLEAHNVWLSVLGQAGALGLSGFVALLVLLTRGWLWRPRSQPPWAENIRSAIVASFVGAFLYHGI